MSTRTKLSRMTIDMSKEFHKQLKIAAADQDKSMRDIVIESLELYLRDHTQSHAAKNIENTNSL
jgi:hypothetical protein